MQPALGLLPTFSGHEGLSAAEGMQRGGRGESRRVPVGGTGRATAGCLIQSKRKYLLLPLSNVFAPDVFEHLLWTGVQENITGKHGR